MEVKINKEIQSYSESMFFGLSMRQCGFSLAAILVAVGLYFLLKPYVGTETVSWMCILGAAPFAAMGFVNYHGMTAKQLAWAWIRSELLEPKRLISEPDNLYYKLLEDTISNHRMSQINFEKSIPMPMQWDGLDDYREEYNQMLLDKATNGNGIVQEKFITISVRKKDVDAARSFFARVEADLSSHFAALGSTCGPINAMEQLQILHRFYRSGEENEFRFSLRDSARKGHSFRDYICPDSMEWHSDYLQIGNRFAPPTPRTSWTRIRMPFSPPPGSGCVRWPFSNTSRWTD